MSHFYSIITGKSDRAVSRTGTKSSGIRSIVASWEGAIEVRLFNTPGGDTFRIALLSWPNSAEKRVLLSGHIDKLMKDEQRPEPEYYI